MSLKKFFYFLILFLIVLFNFENTVLAADSNQKSNCKEHSLQGFAWSDGIGWISFDCRSAGINMDYGIDFEKDYTLSGLAWSDAVGWIDFQYFGGDDRARYNPSTGKLEGKAKILSGVDDYNDGWTGTIDLNGIASNGYHYAPEYDKKTRRLKGYGWGDQFVGWVDFAPGIESCQDNTDSDRDGISDCVEERYPICAQNIIMLRMRGDTDGDGVDDYDECKNGTDPELKNSCDGTEDTDGDGIRDCIEQLYPICAEDTSVLKGRDTDGDGVDDYDECKNGTNPDDPTNKMPVGGVFMDPFYFRFYGNKGTDDDPVQKGDDLLLSWLTNDTVSCKASEGGSTTWTDNPNKPLGDIDVATEIIKKLTSDTLFKLTCKDNSGNELTKSVVTKVSTGEPKLKVWAEDYDIDLNQKAKIHYEIKNVEKCRIKNDELNLDQELQNGDGEFVYETEELTEPVYNFEISCEPDDKTYNNVLERVYINVAKLLIEFYPNSNVIQYQKKVKLFWRVEFAETKADGSKNCWVEINDPEFDTFDDNITYKESLQSWTSPDEFKEEEKEYEIIMKCKGKRGDLKAKKVKLTVGRKPQYIEI